MERRQLPATLPTYQDMAGWRTLDLAVGAGRRRGWQRSGVGGVTDDGPRQVPDTADDPTSARKHGGNSASTALLGRGRLYLRVLPDAIIVGVRNELRSRVQVEL